MDFTSLIPSLERYGAPLIIDVLSAAATATLGPLGGIAVKGVSDLVLNKLGAGMGTAADPVAIQQAIVADPAKAAIVIPQVESDHADVIKATLDAANEELRLRLLDVQDSRTTEVEYVKAGSFIQAVPGIWTLVVVGSFIGVLIVLLARTFNYTTEQLSLLNIMLGVLVGEVARCGSFWLGSSQSSRLRADQAIDFAHKSQAPPVGITKRK